MRGILCRSTILQLGSLQKTKTGHFLSSAIRNATTALREAHSQRGFSRRIGKGYAWDRREALTTRTEDSRGLPAVIKEQVITVSPGNTLLTRDEALSLVTEHVSKRNVVCHTLAVEAIMRSIAKRLGESEDSWGMLGLLHEIDYEKTEDTPERHGLLALQILDGKVPREIIRAIEAHNCEGTSVKSETRMEKVLIACDAISGLLVACALVMPSKKPVDVRLETLAKKFNDKDFARGADRGRIMMCEEIGIPKAEFSELTSAGLKNAALQIGL
jgi:putative nucleotidyltransferase with HDIG domain